MIGLKWKTLTSIMAKMIIEKTARTVGILESALFLRQIVLAFFAVYFVLDLVLNINQSTGNVI